MPTRNLYVNLTVHHIQQLIMFTGLSTSLLLLWQAHMANNGCIINNEFYTVSPVTVNDLCQLFLLIDQFILQLLLIMISFASEKNINIPEHQYVQYIVTLSIYPIQSYYQYIQYLIKTINISNP